MADLLRADAIQQLEVALLGSPMAQVIDILVGGLIPSSIVAVPAQPHPRAYTSTPTPPSPTSVLVLGVITISPRPAMASTSVGDESALPQAKAPKVSKIVQHHQITPTPVELSSSTIASWSSTEAETLPIVVVPELAVQAEAYPECLNRPGGGKDYLCCLCLFRHSNLDSILTHVRKHLEFTIGCPVCGKGYQNAASFHMHGRDVHHIQIVASVPSVDIMSQEGV